MYKDMDNDRPVKHHDSLVRASEMITDHRIADVAVMLYATGDNQAWLEKAVAEGWDRNVAVLFLLDNEEAITYWSSRAVTAVAYAITDVREHTKEGRRTR